MSKVLGRKLFKKQSSRGKGITSMLEDFPQGFAEGGEVSPRDGMTAEERKRLATEMLSRAREEGYTFIEEGERPSLTRQAAVGAAPAMGPDPRAAQQLAMMQQMGMMPPRFQRGGLNDLTMGGGMPNPFTPPPMMVERPGAAVPASPAPRAAPLRSENLPASEPDVGAINTFGSFGLDMSAPLPERVELGIPLRLPFTPRMTDAPIEEDPEREMLRERNRALGLSSLPKDVPPASEVPKPEEGEGAPKGEPEKAMPPRRGEGGVTSVAAPAVSKADVLMEGIKARREELKAERDQSKWLALMQAGLAMAAGRSPSAISNIGAGGIAGLQALRESQRDIRREERELTSDEMKLALTREQAAAEAAYRNATLAMRERELAGTEELRKAQAEYYRARPGAEAAQLEQRRQAALAQARIAAEKAVDDMIKANPMQFMTPKGTIDTMKRDIEVSRRYNALAPLYTRGAGGGGDINDPLGLRSTIAPPGE